jgi:hypothetical protein
VRRRISGFRIADFGVSEYKEEFAKGEERYNCTSQRVMAEGR